MGPDSVPLIKAAALELFAAKGYANASLEELAARVGFTKGGIYYYFRSKEQLLLQLLEDIEDRSIRHTEQVIASREGSPIEDLEAYSNAQAAWAGRNPADLAILMLTSLETVHDDGPVGRKVRAIYDRMQTLLTGIVEAGKVQGLIASERPTSVIVLALMAIHDGKILLWYRSGCDPVMGRVLATLSRRLLLERFESESSGLERLLRSSHSP